MWFRHSLASVGAYFDARSSTGKTEASRGGGSEDAIALELFFKHYKGGHTTSNGSTTTT